MKADSDNLSLIMTDTSLYQDATNLIFLPTVTQVPFKLQDIDGNIYKGEEGIKQVSYTFASNS